MHRSWSISFFATGILARGRFLAAIFSLRLDKIQYNPRRQAFSASGYAPKVQRDACLDVGWSPIRSRRRRHQPNWPTTVLQHESHIVATRRPPEMPPATKSVVTIWSVGSLIQPTYLPRFDRRVYSIKKIRRKGTIQTGRRHFSQMHRSWSISFFATGILARGRFLAAIFSSRLDKIQSRPATLRHAKLFRHPGMRRKCNGTPVST